MPTVSLAIHLLPEKCHRVPPSIVSGDYQPANGGTP